jgi:anti-anti-sigma factor
LKKDAFSNGVITDGPEVFSVLSLSVSLENQATVLKVAGELDLSTVPEFKAFYEKHKPINGLIVFDMTGLEFVDSTGVGSLLAIWKDLNQSQQPFSVCNLSDDVYEVLEVMGVPDFLGEEHFKRSPL